MSNGFSKGIIQDTTEYNQPQSSCRYALNFSFETVEGDLSAYSSEDGNTLKLNLPYTIIGTLNLPDERILIFSTDNTVSEIGEYSSITEEYKTLIKSSCLNFSTKNPVRALLRVRKGCERIIYFTDRVNPYRSINLDSLIDYTSSSTIEEANSNDNWDCDKFRLSSLYTIPKITLDSVNDAGGDLEAGTYIVAVRYLDKDLNPSNYFLSSNPIPIVDEPLSSNYSQIDGAIPTFNSQTTGSVPTTNKSITLTVDNLDENQSYIQLAFIHYTSTIKAVTGVYLTEYLPINNDSITYTYQGKGDLEQGVLDEIIIDNAPIEVVNAHAIYDSSLWLGGLKNGVKDYSKFQRYASKIKTTFKTKLVKVTDQNNPGDPKCPFTYWDTRTLIGDEVYALGIAYRFKNGTLSPVFHIQGRPIEDADNTLISNSVDTAHLGEGSQPRWKVENTGYYQLDNHVYPDIRGCDNEDIWGVDYEGNSLLNTPIRHHRAPSRREYPTYVTGSDKISIIGLEFSNVEYPDPDIIGHVFYIAKTDSVNNIVHDSFVAIPNTHYDNPINGSEIDYFGELQLDSSAKDYGNTFSYFSPTMLFDRKVSKGNHLKFTSRVTGTSEVFDISTYVVVGLFNQDKVVESAKWSLGEGDYFPATPLNRVLSKQYIISPYSYLPSNSFLTYPIYNFAVTSPVGIVVTQDNVEETIPHHFLTGVFMSFYKEVYTDIFNIVYRPAHTNDLVANSTSDTFEIFSAGDGFVTYLNIPWIVHNSTVEEYAAGIFSSIFTPFLNSLFIRGRYISGVWIDSRINTALRHGDDSDYCTSYYKGGLLNDYFANKVMTPDPDQPSKWNLREIPCTEFYAYNPDYTIVNEIKANFPLPKTYDYCSECQNEFPYRLVASDVSYQEETVDTFKIFRALSRTDLPGETGIIESLKVFNDRLYAITKEGLYYIPVKPETITTSDSSIFLTKGERFAIPPKRILTTEVQYNGTQHDLSVLSTEYGIVYANSNTGKVFFFSKSLEELSSRGLRYFFFDNLKLFLKEQLEQNGIEYNLHNSPTHRYGTGIISTYDPLKKRIIISKKDYKFIGHLELTNDTSAIGKVIFDGDRFYIRNSDNTELQIDFNDIDYFENKSFTVSYSLTRQAWESFYSFLPTLFSYDHRTFYSILNKEMWEHNQDNKSNSFYGTTYEGVIDFIEESAPLTKNLKTIPTKYSSSIFYSLKLNHTCSLGDVIYPYRTFDKACFYNSYQISPITDIEVKDPGNPFATVTSNNKIIVEKLDTEFHMSNIRDFVVTLDSPLFTNSWDLISNIYPIDKVPNPQVYDIDKSLYNQARLRDRYLGVRLYFKPKEGEKIILTGASSSTKQ